MFSLIISIIAIALVAALALASIYYGGDAFQEGTAKAEAATIVNQGQQVQGAFTMAEINDVTVASIDTLTPAYLKEVPQVRGADWVLNLTDGIATLAVTSTEVCTHVETMFDSVVTVDATQPDSTSLQAFGCFGTVGAYSAYYKL